MLSRGEGYEEGPFRKFIGRRIEGYRRLVAEGKGGWYGAFLEGRLVADLGLFWGARVGRFQYVETHPDYRRRGICSTLIYEAGVAALREQGIGELVIVAEGDDVSRIYESVGFERVERCASLLRRPE